MRHVLWVALALGVFTSPAVGQTGQCSRFRWDNALATYPPRVQHLSFMSPSAGVNIGFNVAVPAGYETSSGRYPTIYFLHGIGGNENTMVENVTSWFFAAMDAGTIRPSILVFINGAYDSMYADAFDGSRPVETAFIRELIPYVDAHFRTNACREQRAIHGFSMGGHGALLQSFKHPDIFSTVVAYAGAVLPWDDLVARHPSVASCMFHNEEQRFLGYSTWEQSRLHAPELAASLGIRMAVGDQDALEALFTELSAHLTSLSIPHQFEVVAGCGHQHDCLFDAVGATGVALMESRFVACPNEAVDAGVGLPDATPPLDGGSRRRDATAHVDAEATRDAEVFIDAGAQGDAEIYADAGSGPDAGAVLGASDVPVTAESCECARGAKSVALWPWIAALALACGRRAKRPQEPSSL